MSIDLAKDSDLRLTVRVKVEKIIHVVADPYDKVSLKKKALQEFYHGTVKPEDEQIEVETIYLHVP